MVVFVQLVRMQFLLSALPVAAAAADAPKKGAGNAIKTIMLAVVAFQ